MINKKKIKLVLYNIIMLVFLIIISFTLITTKSNYYRSKNDKQYIIKVNNEEIGLQEFQRRYAIELIKSNAYSNTKTLNKAYSYKYKKKIYKKVLLDIIHETLLKQYVQRLNISIKHYDVQNYIYNQKNFTRNKNFDIQKYYFFLNTLGISSKEYINIIETHLKINKFISSIINSIFSLKNETTRFNQLFSQGRMISIAPVNKLNFFEENKKIEKNRYRNANFTPKIKKNNINYFFIAKKIIYLLNHKPSKLLKKINLKFQEPQLISRFDNNKFSKLIFNLPQPNAKKNVYFIIVKDNNNLYIAKFFKMTHINLSENQKKFIALQLLQYNVNMTLNSIMNNLYAQAQIEYNSLINFK